MTTRHWLLIVVDFSLPTLNADNVQLFSLSTVTTVVIGALCSKTVVFKMVSRDPPWNEKKRLFPLKEYGLGMGNLTAPQQSWHHWDAGAWEHTWRVIKPSGGSQRLAAPYTTRMQ